MLRTINCLVLLVISVCLFSYQSFGQRPKGYISANTTLICSGMPVYFTVSLSGAAPWSIMLRIDQAPGTLPQYETIDGISENTYTFTRVLYTTSTYTMVLVGDKNNTMDEFFGGGVNVTVKPTLASTLQDDLGISGPNPIDCQSGQTVLNAPSGKYHQWYKNDFYIATKLDLSQFDITSIGAGSYYVVTTDNNCIQKKSKKIVVNTVTNSLKPIVSGDSVISCGRSDVILSTAPGFSRYDWKKDNQLVQSGSINTVNANLYGEGKYTVTAFLTTNCSFTSDQFSVKYTYPFERPIVSPSVDIGKDFITCLKNTNIFTGPNGYQKYEWWVNGKLKQTGNSDSFNANSLGAGSYYIILTVYDNNNCFRSSDGFNLFMGENPINPRISHSSPFICPDAPVQL